MQGVELECFFDVADFFSDAIRTAFDVTQKIQGIFRKKHRKSCFYSQLEKLAKGQFVVYFF